MEKKSFAVIPSTTSALPTLPIDPSQILTLSELSERLKVSERWCYEKSRRRCRNPLPTIRIGRYLRYRWDHVSEWMMEQSTRKVTFDVVPPKDIDKKGQSNRAVNVMPLAKATEGGVQ